ncbi:MAG: M24 family metallopeptidase [Dehalococcoidia bacterium]
MSSTFTAAQEYLGQAGIDGWLTRDYRYTNPVFWNALGNHVRHLTRPVWLFIPSDGEPVLLAHDVDAGRFPGSTPPIRRYSNRRTMIEGLQSMLPHGAKVAMEYSPLYELPRVGRVDAGTIELVRSLGVEVVSSGDVLQYATERWSPAQLQSHRYAVESLTGIVKDAFKFVGENVRWKLTEHDVAEYIRGRFDRSGLVTEDGPSVQFNDHSSDPHYEPTPAQSAVIRRQGWLLIDLWARQAEGDTIYADITWTARIGDGPTPEQQKVFDAVINSRDAAFELLEEQVLSGRYPQGWELDRVARDVIDRAGYGDYFVHRLGHSLGREVHANGVNLDDWETHDTRTVIDGIGLTIEPGVYLPEFGVRSEIDVYMSGDGPEITGEAQREIFHIET